MCSRENGGKETKNHDCLSPDTIGHWRGHLLAEFQVRVQNFICPICHRNLERQANYQNHSHIQILAIQANYVTYKHRSNESALAILVKKQCISEVVALCVSEQLSLENDFPGISVPLSWWSSDQNQDYDKFFNQYANPKGVSLYQEVCSKMYLLYFYMSCPKFGIVYVNNFLLRFQPSSLKLNCLWYPPYSPHQNMFVLCIFVCIMCVSLCKINRFHKTYVKIRNFVCSVVTKVLWHLHAYFLSPKFDSNDIFANL